jgi:hypothetical protein
MDCDRKSCGNQQGDNKIHAHGISRRVAPLGTVPAGTIEAFADMVPWGTNVKGEKGENGFEPIGTDDRDLVTHRSPSDGPLGRTWRTSREPPAGASTNSPVAPSPTPHRSDPALAAAVKHRVEIGDDAEAITRWLARVSLGSVRAHLWKLHADLACIDDHLERVEFLVLLHELQIDKPFGSIERFARRKPVLGPPQRTPRCPTPLQLAQGARAARRRRRITGDDVAANGSVPRDPRRVLADRGLGSRLRVRRR